MQANQETLTKQLQITREEAEKECSSLKKQLENVSTYKLHNNNMYTMNCLVHIVLPDIGNFQGTIISLFTDLLASSNF